MRDYEVCIANTRADIGGRPLKVAQLPTGLIQEILAGWFEFLPSDDDNVTLPAMMERLRLELDIRRMGLR